MKAGAKIALTQQFSNSNSIGLKIHYIGGGWFLFLTRLTIWILQFPVFIYYFQIYIAMSFQEQELLKQQPRFQKQQQSNLRPLSLSDSLSGVREVLKQKPRIHIPRTLGGDNAKNNEVVRQTTRKSRGRDF